MRVPLWHRKRKTSFAARTWRLCLVALVVGSLWSNKVVYDLDGTTLTIRKERFYCLHSRGMLASDILGCKVETEKAWFGLCERQTLAVLGKGGECLSHCLGKDAARFHAGLTQALHKQPVGTFHGEHRDVPVAEIVFLIIMLADAACGLLARHKEKKAPTETLEELRKEIDSAESPSVAEVQQR